MACKKCNKYVNDTERICCRGFYGSTFHVFCVNVDLPVLDILGENSRNIFWMCNECADLFSNEHFKNIMLRNECTASAPSDTMQALKADIEKLSCAINTLSSKVDNKLQTVLPVPSIPWGNRNNLMPNTPKRRREDSVNPVEPTRNLSSTRGTKLTIGTVKTVPLNNNLFWINLSAFHPNTSEDEITALVQDCLSLNPETKPKVIKLVPRGKDLTTLRYVSFKVGVSRDSKTVALSSDSWPENVLFREMTRSLLLVHKVKLLNVTSIDTQVSKCTTKMSEV